MSDKNIIHEQTYWDAFYQTWGLEVPTQFCVQTVTDLERGASIVEFGSGNGRDSQYFASQGFITTAMDLSASAIAACKEKMASRDIHHAFFRQGDVSLDEDIAATLEQGRRQLGETVVALVVYSRFLLHSLDEEQEQQFIAALARHMRTGDQLYLEFRSLGDANTPKVFGNHYRRYVDTDKLLAHMTGDNDFDVSYTITGQGMARFKAEDPVVSRIIATRN
ncbi:MAG: class I SAM-dependent methyltransferase [Halioglobus sp.]